MQLRTALLTCGALVAGILSCHDLTGPVNSAEIALVRFSQQDGSITAPDSVRVGVAFDVAIVTWGGGCTRTVDHDDVSYDRNVITIRPFNHFYAPDQKQVICPGDLMTITHHVMVTAPATGSNTIRVVGANRGYETNDKTVEWVLDRFVTAVP